MSVPPFSSVTELAAGLAERRWSSRELVEFYLDRIEQTNAKLNAYIEIYPEQALASADASDRLRGAGISLGPLHGVPIAIKDLIEWEGRACTVGSKAWEHRVSTFTATVMRRVLAAGMIVVGKTHMVEFALGVWGTNPVLGTPWNPWDLAVHRVPGGSSSGSAVAVASALAPIALGSDTGGSIRIPAALNGLAGLKPTYGRVSLYGCIPLSTTLDSVGPIGRTVADVAALMAVIDGPDHRDPATLTAPSQEYGGWRSVAARGMRVAVMREDESFTGLDLDVWGRFCEAQRVMQGLGVHLETVELPVDLLVIANSNGLLTIAEAYAYHRHHIHDDKLPFGPPVRERILRGEAVSAADYIDLCNDRRRTGKMFLDWMQSFDALLTPTLPMAAVPVTAVDEKQTTLGLFTRLANYVGGCAMTLPSGFSGAGLPIGLQLTGKPFDEARLLALGNAYEVATQHGREQPDLSALGL